MDKIVSFIIPSYNVEKYLNVSPLKLQAKGVKSVRSRVVNLRDFRPELTLEELRAALVKAFGEVYGLPVQTLTEEELDAAKLAAGQARFSDPAWIYGDSQPLEVSREAACSFSRRAARMFWTATGSG